MDSEALLFLQGLSGELRNSIYDYVISDYLKSQRYIETPCPVCRGSGVIVYGNGSTWKGGIGGAAMTPGVCDKCWGTGDAYRKGVNLRLDKQIKERDEKYIRKLENELKKFNVNIEEIE